MEKDGVFTLDQIAKHNVKKDCWFVINGKVLDVTKFLDEHPGGEEALMEYAGNDATKAFENVGHSGSAYNLLLRLKVGRVEGNDIKSVEEDHLVSDEQQVSEANVMEAHVIKDEPGRKDTTIVEFLVPLLVACLYFGYRFMA